MAFDPPPTQAITASGRRPSFQDLRFGLFANHALEFTHNRRERVRTGRGAQHIVRLFVAAGPVAQRSLQASFSVAEPLCTGITSAPIRRIRKTFGDWRSTSWPHVDTAFQAEQGAGQR